MKFTFEICVGTLNMLSGVHLPMREPQSSRKKWGCVAGAVFWSLAGVFGDVSVDVVFVESTGRFAERNVLAMFQWILCL